MRETLGKHLVFTHRLGGTWTPLISFVQVPGHQWKEPGMLKPPVGLLMEQQDGILWYHNGSANLKLFEVKALITIKAIGSVGQVKLSRQ